MLRDYSVLFVGVHCSSEELKRREQLRGDRHIGLAISQIEFVHRQEVYDIEVNTSLQSTAECANEIVKRLASTEPLTGFKQSLTISNG